MAWEKLQAFKELKETTENSLNETEKTNLNKINAADIRAEKTMIWEKTFKIDWKDMKLKDIVSNLKFSTDGRTATLNWKQIAKISELWAAIQVYVIANDKGVGSTKIDGWVWKNTIIWIQSTQNSMKAEWNSSKEKSTDNNEKAESIDLDDILGRSTYKYFIKYLKEDRAQTIKDSYKIFSSAWDWKLDRSKVVVDKTNKKLFITYYSQQKSTNTKVEVPFSAFQNQDLTVDSKKLVVSIDNKIKNSEQKLWEEKREKRVQEWIDDYPERSIADPVVKKYFVDKKVDFEFVRTEKINWVPYAVIKNWNNDKWIERKIPYNKILDKNSKYTVGTYAWALVGIYKNDAIDYVTKELQNDLAAAKEISTSKVEAKKSSYETIKNVITNYKKDSNYEKNFDNELTEATKQYNYYNSLSILNSVEKNISEDNSEIKNENELERIVWITEVTENWVTIKVVDYGARMGPTNFAAVGKRADYIKRTEALVKKTYKRGYREINKQER